ncbi:EamA family transporter [Aeromicrobium chenweiae]|uniref:EamA family transporter n=1 Tax=Aeromicrobium chenweiae TaxID=2079793 RepID=A0A2S0WRD4_9ACTN|nr:EamA family transporter [Aeromicrobium chenweiae]AWB93818.1 EamA family transporter [Aeromicrobium chenweiae]TGN30863.1 EamA family transporter [Aeromicrobium chenweiae]
MPARNPRLGYVLVIVAAVLFGINGGVSRVAMGSGLTPEAFTTLRITGATAVFVAYAACFRRTALRRPRGSALILVMALGLVGVTGLQLTYNVAIDRLPLGIALLIEYLAPVLVVLWVRFVRKEHVRPRMWAAVALSVVGLAVVGRVWNGIELDGLGVLMALLAAVCFAAYFLIGEHNVGFDDPLRVILWAFVVATVAMNLIQPIWTTPDLPGSTTLLGRLDGHDVNPWVVVGVVVVMGTVLPFFLEMIALQHLPATVVTVVAMLEPVIANVLGWAWFRESLTPVQLVGAAAVLAGIVLAQTSRRAELTIPAP